MASRYLGEIRIFGGDYAPAGWALCDGKLLRVSEHAGLFALLGTTYGGDGKSTFALPDLRGRIPIHSGTNPDTGTSYERGKDAGTAQTSLTVQHMPVHSHFAQAQSGDGGAQGPAGAVWAKPGTVQQYFQGVADRDMHPDAIAIAGENKPHDNLMPYLAINFIISLDGLPRTSIDKEATLAEIRMFSYDAIAPGWERCDGQELQIADNQALFSIIGNRFGGDGERIFKLPDLRGRAPVHRGEDVAFAQSGGVERHALTVAEMPAHTHRVSAQSQQANATVPAPTHGRGFIWAASTAKPFASTPNVQLHVSAISEAGAGQPHENMQPYRVLIFCIATRGIFPTRP